MKTIVIALLATLIGGTSYGQARNPVGEKAKYILDNSRARTTSMIRSGTALAEITGYLRDQKAFNARLTYDLNIDWVGRKSGEKELAAPEEYFQPEFLEKLRREKKIVLPRFTVTHMGFADAKDKNGKLYRNCDKVMISDIKQAHEVPFFELLEESFGQVAVVTNTQIEDLKILAHVSLEVPVLGAVKIDLSGKASGFDFKAGFDYTNR